MKAFVSIVNRLNDEGHDLTPYNDLTPGDYSFRGTEKNANCGLRLGCDVVISSGYSDTVEI